MGLFKKRATDPDQMQRLHAEIAAMGARLSASDQSKDELRQTVDGLVTRISRPISPPPTEPPPPPAPVFDPAELNLLNAKIERLGSRLDESADAANTPAVDPERVEQMSRAMAELAARVDGVESAGDTGSADSARIDELRSMLDRIDARFDEVDRRITSISTELANQITEMSGELEAMGDSEPATDEIVDELRDAQTRLASEQARYQIAFRQDLAQLADRLKRA